MTPIEQAREALEALLKYATSENQGHLYEGDCPDESQPGSRDPACPACKAMNKAAAALAALSASPAHADLLKLEALADAYAKAAATAHVESLYGGSKDYTRECVGKSNKARSDLMQALSAAPAAPAAPDGWVMVPKEPTPEMLAAGYKSAWSALLGDYHNTDCRTDEERSAKAMSRDWSAMLTAAPAAPTQGAQPERGPNWNGPMLPTAPQG